MRATVNFLVAYGNTHVYLEMSLKIDINGTHKLFGNVTIYLTLIECICYLIMSLKLTLIECIYYLEMSLNI